MPDVTVSQLAGSLEGFHVEICHGGSIVRGKVRDADEVAERLHATLGRMAALRGDQPQHSDPELRAMATIAELLIGLDDPEAVSRVLRYFAERYGLET